MKQKEGREGGRKGRQERKEGRKEGRKGTPPGLQVVAKPSHGLFCSYPHSL
jgi:hypothetical protein